MTEAAGLLEFWFGQLSDGFADEAHRQRWFSGDSAFDDDCRMTFSSLAARAADGELDDWLDEPRSCLAFILLTDQIPRNIHRGGKLWASASGTA